MVFIDGSNLYHVLGENCGRHDVQFDKLGLKLANGRQLKRIYYYNIRQESERQPEQSREQEKFLASMHDTPYVEVRLGIWKQRGDEMIEKGVDVMLATDLVVKALRDQYDTGIVVSGDADFFPAIQAAKDAGKQIEVAAFDSNLSPEAARVADLHVRFTKSWFTSLWMARRGASDADEPPRRDAEEPAPRRAAAPRREPARRGRTGRTSRTVEPAAGTLAVEAAPSISGTEAPPDQPASAEAAEGRAAPLVSQGRSSIRRTPARRRIGGTMPAASANGHSSNEAPETASQRALPEPPPLRRAEPGAEQSAAPESLDAAATTSDATATPKASGTARRAGWLRRLGVPGGEGAAPETDAPSR
jgi:uncharacterized LabA/DUF88 family protein